MKIPEFLRRYFWDIDFSKLDSRVDSKDILSRILEYGDKRAITWMKRNFTKDEIADILFNLRAVSPKSANFWALIFGIDKKKILCLQKHYLEIRKRHWPYVGKSHLLDNAYLGGGTACALQLGHRVSVDLYFFTPEEFDTKELVLSLKKISRFKVESQSWRTVLGAVEGVRFSIFVYKYPVLFQRKSMFNIRILDLRDIAAMKIDAISTRGIKRDFIDLYYICQKGISLKKTLSFYERKYGKLSSNIVHIQKSLSYFVDAEVNRMPRMLKPCKWGEVKKFFEKEVKKIATAIL